MRAKIVLSLAAALVIPSAHAVDNYKIDPAHTSINFSVRHLGLSTVKGHFDQFAGMVALDNGAIKEASAAIQVKSVNTGIEQRDNHLRTGDFFDAANHPVITFKTKSVEKRGEQVLLVADFTMRGVTKEMRLPVTLSGPIKDPMGSTRVGLEARTTVNRKDYGLSFNKVLDTGALMVGEEVSIEINAEAVLQVAGDAGKK